MLTIRPASLSDAQAIQAIYTPYVEKTAFTFEYEVPSVQEFEKRICKTLEKYPYLVAEENGQVLGYAYASTYYARTAYDWTTELSIYVAMKMRVDEGLGSASFMTALEEELASNEASYAFWPVLLFRTRRALPCMKNGAMFKLLIFQKLATSLSKWHDIVWMQKTIDGPVRKIQ